MNTRRASVALGAAILTAAAAVPLGACAATRPMEETEIAAEPVALAARAMVTHTAIGVVVEPPGGSGSSMGAVRPVTCVRLPGGELLTAAHTLPREHLGAGPMHRDPVTGAWRVDRRTPDGGDDTMVLIVDDRVGTARVTASDTLRYATAAEASRAAAPADWAVVTPDERRDWETPVRRIGEAQRGERCFMVGFPGAMMDPALFEAGDSTRDARSLPWVGVPGVVIEGRIALAGRDRVLIETGGTLGKKARGLSGGGVFVDRGGEAVLVGIAVQASAAGGEVTACPLPRAVTKRFD
jgi:hypothetical protein